eukprot:gene24524-10128_t
MIQPGPSPLPAQPRASGIRGRKDVLRSSWEFAAVQEARTKNSSSFRQLTATAPQVRWLGPPEDTPAQDGPGSESTTGSEQKPSLAYLDSNPDSNPDISETTAHKQGAHLPRLDRGRVRGRAWGSSRGVE